MYNERMIWGNTKLVHLIWEGKTSACAKKYENSSFLPEVMSVPWPHCNNLFKMNRYLIRGTLLIQRALFLCLIVIFLTSIKLLFDLWPLIWLTMFEWKSTKCPSDKVSIHFKEIFLRVHAIARLEYQMQKSMNWSTQQNSYSISHLLGTVTTQWLPLWRCSHCYIVPDTVTTEQWLHRTHTLLGIHYHGAYVEICLLGT